LTISETQAQLHLTSTGTSGDSWAIVSAYSGSIEPAGSLFFYNATTGLPALILGPTGIATVTNKNQNGQGFIVQDTGNAASSFAGIGLKSTNGSTSPNKWIRSDGSTGRGQFINSGYSAVITDWDDSGNWNMSGSVTCGALSATTGTFSGAVSGTTGTFSNNINLSISGSSASITATNTGNLKLTTTATSGGQIQLYPQTNSSNGLSIITTGVNPFTDNTMNLGISGSRFIAVWAVNGTIQTSDGREKSSLQKLIEAEIRAANRILETIGIYRWKKDLDALGDDASWHIGVIAQTVCHIFEEEGLRWQRYGMITYEDDRYGINYAELNAFLSAGLHSRLKRIEAAMGL
jgi:hypothetical protein